MVYNVDIGTSNARTWAYCRSPIYPGRPDNLFDYEAASPSTEVFRVANGPITISEVTDQPPTWFQGVGGLIAQCLSVQTEYYPSPVYKTFFWVGGWNVSIPNDYDPTDTYNPNFLDEDDIQYWDNAFVDTSIGSFNMTTEAVDGDFVYQEVGAAGPAGLKTVNSITLS
jgi:hypothetical protein